MLVPAATTAVSLAIAASASAAPRLSNVSKPAPVTGDIISGTFPACGATGVVPLSFTANEPGTLLLTSVQTAPIGLGTLFPGVGQVSFRAGVNTIDLRAVPGMVGGLSGGLTETGANRSVRVSKLVTLLPFNSRLQFGSRVTRTTSVTCRRG